MKKISFLIVGSGWRSLYYVRIARALPQLFEVCAMLCRKQEKAKQIEENCHIRTSLSEEECEAMHPDFVVVAVDKAHIKEVTLHWAKKGFAVLGETPAAMDEAALCELWKAYLEGRKIIFAEQYHRYPINIARKKLIDEGYLGKTDYLYLSLAHEYHGISLMRRFLNIDVNESFKVCAKQFSFDVKKTLDRCQKYNDGSVRQSPRSLALFEFNSGKLCSYDFDSEQYRSLIRNDSYRLQGVNGELFNDELCWIDENNQAQREKFRIDKHIVMTGNENPNLDHFEEIERIAFEDQILYEAPFQNCGLSQDETAIASLLCDMYDYAKNNAAEPYSLKEALQDAYASILLRKAIETGQTLQSEMMPWNI